ncbi:MAG TPA: hypothetical protein VIH37_08350 [Candidatus Limnocylindrales bacterium]
MALRRLRILVIPASLLLAVVAALPASAAAPRDLTVSGRCSGTSVTDLQIGREDNGKLSIDFGVDMARHASGIAWRVSMTDNGIVIANVTVRTIADGSFSITRLISPRPGANHIVARARRVTTGEICRLSATA